MEAGGEDRLQIESESEANEKLTKINTSKGEIKKKEGESEANRLESESGANGFGKLTSGGEDLAESSMFQRGRGSKRRSAVKRKAAIGGKNKKSQKIKGRKKRTSKKNMVKKRKTKGETQKNQRRIKEKENQVDQFYGKQNKKKKAKIGSKKTNKEKMTNKRILKIKQRKQKASGDKVKICPKNGVPAVCLFNAQKVLNYERLQVVQ